MRSVPKGGWKLVRYLHINYTQLFGLHSDSFELNNLARRADQVGRAQPLTSLLKSWQKDVGDTQPLSTSKPATFAMDLAGRKRTPDRWQPGWIRRKYFGLK